MASEEKISVRFPHDPEMFFDSAVDFEAFLNREVLAWQQWQEHLDQAGLARQPISSFDRRSLANGWVSLRNRTDKPLDGKASRVSSMLASRSIIYSKSDLGNMVLSLAEEAPNLSAWIALTYTSSPLVETLRQNQLQEQWFWSTLASGLPKLLQTVPSKQREESARLASLEAESHANAAAESARAAQNIVEASERQIAEVVERFVSVAGSVTRQAHERARVQLTASRAEWETLRRALQLKMQTRAPYTYWRQKQMNHRVVAAKWMQTFVWSVVAGGLGITLGAAAIITFGPFGPWPWLAPVVCLGVPGFAALWVGRLANRQYAANILRAEDAGERSVMVRTLLALSEKSDRIAGDAEFLTMVSALFRPGPGLATDDSPAVGALDAAVKALQGQTDRNAQR